MRGKTCVLFVCPRCGYRRDLAAPADRKSQTHFCDRVGIYVSLTGIH